MSLCCHWYTLYEMHSGIFDDPSPHKSPPNAQLIKCMIQEHFQLFDLYLVKCKLLNWNSTWAVTDVSQVHENLKS